VEESGFVGFLNNLGSEFSWGFLGLMLKDFCSAFLSQLPVDQHPHSLGQLGCTMPAVLVDLAGLPSRLDTEHASLV